MHHLYIEMVGDFLVHVQAFFEELLLRKAAQAVSFAASSAEPGEVASTSFSTILLTVRLFGWQSHQVVVVVDRPRCYLHASSLA